MTTYNYKGIDYDLPDTFSDEEALKLIKKEAGEFNEEPPQETIAQEQPKGSALGNIVKSTGNYLKGAGEQFFPQTIEQQKNKDYQQQPFLQKAIQTPLALAGDIGTIPQRAVSGLLGQGSGAGEYALKKPVEAINKKIKGEGFLPELARGSVEAVGNTLSDPILMGQATKPLKLAEKASQGLQNVGKGFLGAEMKIKNTLAQRGYGSNIAEKKQNLLNAIAENDLESKIGNFAKMAKKASSKASENFDKADEIVQQIANDKNSQLINVVDEVKKIGTNSIKEVSNAGEEDAANNVLEKILKSLESKGLDSDNRIDALVYAKKLLNKRGDLFKKGPAPTGEEAINTELRKRIYLGLVDKIGEISPEIKQLNTQGKTLLDISDIANDAASRTTNLNKVSLTDWIAGAGAGAASAVAKDPTLLALTLGALGGKKLLSQGRGASALIQAGKGIENFKSALGNIANKEINTKAPNLGNIGNKIMSEK